MANAEEQYTFFWNEKSVFSQFYPCQFVVGDIEYNCAEQYMMHQKAVVFGDAEAAEEILLSADPRKHKSLGRRVRNYNEDIWNERCCDVVKQGNRAKFGQNLELKKMLLATEESTLVEASPRDCKWGIGLSSKNPKALTKSTWRGKNLLGYCLTEVRDEFLKEDS